MAVRIEALAVVRVSWMIGSTLKEAAESSGRTRAHLHVDQRGDVVGVRV